MINIRGFDTLDQYTRLVREGVFPSLDTQKYKSLSEYSSSWNTFVYYESSRAAEQHGYGFSPLAYFNDLLYNI